MKNFREIKIWLNLRFDFGSSDFEVENGFEG